MASGRTILFVHASSDLYGSDRVVLEVVRALGPHDRAIVALPDDVLPDGPLVGALHDIGAEVRIVRMAVLRRVYLRPVGAPVLITAFGVGVAELARLIQTRQVDVVVSNTIAVMCGAVAAALTRRPHVWYVHETLSDEPRPLRLVLRTALALLPGRIIANSRATARSIAGRNRRLHARTRVIYPGFVDASLAPSEPQRPARGAGERLSVVVVGRLAPRKGIAEALEAIVLLRRRGVELELHLFGSPPDGQEWREREYRRQAADRGIYDLVTFHGFVADASERIAGYDIVLVPSQRPEGFGLTIVEGMLAGRSVVACRNGGGSDELLVDGVTGIYCDLQPLAIASALERLAGDAELRASLGSAAARDAMSRFSIERFRRDTLTVLAAQSERGAVR